MEHIFTHYHTIDYQQLRETERDEDNQSRKSLVVVHQAFLSFLFFAYQKILSIDDCFDIDYVVYANWTARYPFIIYYF